MNVFNTWWIGSVGIALPTEHRGYEARIGWSWYYIIPNFLGRFLVWAIFSRLGTLS